MKVYVPEHFILTAKSLSKGKTPAIRTKGFQEQSGQQRGAGDISDTVGCFALFQYLVELKIPSEYHLTALQGDQTDLSIKLNNITYSLNVKTSSWQPNDDKPETCCHLAIKESEFDKLSDFYYQIMTHLSPTNDKPHVHFCGGISKDSLDLKKYYQTIPNTGGSKGLWIPASNLISIKKFNNL
jgi:hypothetical protein